MTSSASSTILVTNARSGSISKQRAVAATFLPTTRRCSRQRLKLPPAGDAGGSFSLIHLFGLLRLTAYLARNEPRLLGKFWRTGRECWRNNPNALGSVVTLMVLYLHLGRFAASVVKSVRRQIAALDNGQWQSPPLVPAPPADAPIPMQAAE
jgi:hypothetical protein